VTIVVPFPPGGGTDTGTRVIAQKLSQKWGQPVIVENKPGAAGILGAEQVSKAKPDGYTLMMGNIGTQSINPSLYGKKLTYNPDNAFTPVTLVAELPMVMLAGPATSAKTAADVITASKANPGKTTYSSSGPGGSMHLAGALFEKETKTELLHVPYKGGGPAIADLIAGHVDISFATDPGVERAHQERAPARARGHQRQTLPHARRRADPFGVGIARLQHRLVDRPGGACRHAQGRGREDRA
jgi:tripartite-type tricarboxylate transporter receptor subunit TctC